MKRSFRVIAAIAFAVVLSSSLSLGAAGASSHEHGCIPENDHSSADLYRYPHCPGHRDFRDDGHKAGSEDRGPFGNLF
jgi:hypothetical protein